LYLFLSFSHHHGLAEENYLFLISSTSAHLTHPTRMDYHQEYIPHEYLELKMPAGRDRNGNPTFLLDQNHLHIWPRHAFMLVALPNKVRNPVHLCLRSSYTVTFCFMKDKSFTCTLFAPTVEFDSLTTREAFSKWFNQYFPDAFRLIGEMSLMDDFEQNPRSALISIKVRPDKAILPVCLILSSLSCRHTLIITKTAQSSLVMQRTPWSRSTAKD
jgi:hypothetical protein